MKRVYWLNFLAFTIVGACVWIMFSREAWVIYYVGISWGILHGMLYSKAYI